MPLQALHDLVSCAGLVFDSLPFLPLWLEERTLHGLLLPFFLCKLFCLPRVPLFQFPIFLYHLWGLYAVLLLPPNHSWSRPPLNSCNLLFIGRLSKSLLNFVFLRVFISCPKWTICSLVLDIMFYSIVTLARKTNTMRMCTW